MDRLKNILIENQNINPKKGLFFEDSFELNNFSFRELGFALISLGGTIIEEDEDNNYYIVTMKHFLNLAMMIIELKDNKINIVSFAMEGLIKQHTAKKVVNKLKKALPETKPLKTSNLEESFSKKHINFYLAMFLKLCLYIIPFIILIVIIAIIN